MIIKRNEVRNIKDKLSAFSCQLLAVSFRLLALCLILLACTLPATAQQVSANIDREKILLGEAVTLTLKAENVNNSVAPLSRWFSMPDTINHLEVTNRSAIDTIEINGLTTYTQTLTITSFDSGRWQLPALKLLLQTSAAANTTRALATDSLYIDVLPVDVSTLPDYHAIKDIIDVEVKPDYTLVIAAIVSIILLAFLVYFIIKQNKKPRQLTQPVLPKKALFEDTIAQLEALQKQNLPNLLFYTKLDAICRNYIQEQLHVRALHLTQDEMMVQLNTFLPDMEKRTEFYQVLRLVNAVKFAKYNPPQTQQHQAISIAKQTVQQIHYHLQPPPNIAHAS